MVICNVKIRHICVKGCIEHFYTCLQPLISLKLYSNEKFKLWASQQNPSLVLLFHITREGYRFCPNYHPSLYPKHVISSIFLIYSGSFKKYLRTSLVIQWLRTCLPMQRTPVWSLLWEDSVHSRVCAPQDKPLPWRKPLHHNQRADPAHRRESLSAMTKTQHRQEQRNAF